MTGAWPHCGILRRAGHAAVPLVLVFLLVPPTGAALGRATKPGKPPHGTFGA